jgi:U3 small nucleolar RNA-associated protein 10
LLSHVNALGIETTKVKLLESLGLVSSSIKAVSLLPSIETLQTGQGDTILATLLVSSFDASSTPWLNDAEEGLWEVYMQVLKLYLRPTSDPAPREVLIRLLETELFGKLVHGRQVAVCEAIISSVTRDSDAVRARSEYFYAPTDS